MARCRRKKDKPIVVNFCMNCCDDLDEWVKCNLDMLAKVFAIIALRKMMHGKPFPAVSEFESFCRQTHANCTREYRDMTATRH